MTFKGIQDAFCTGCIITGNTHRFNVYVTCLLSKFYVVTDEFLGFLLQWHACGQHFYSFSRPWSSHTAGCPLSNSNWVPSSDCPLPSWSHCGWAYAVHLFIRHQVENPETVTSQSGVYQAYAWRQGWPFPLRTLKGLTASGQVVVQKGLGHRLSRSLDTSSLLCWLSCCSPQLLDLVINSETIL